LYGSQEDILCADAELAENNIAAMIKTFGTVLKQFLSKEFCAEFLQEDKERILCNIILYRWYSWCYLIVRIH